MNRSTFPTALSTPPESASHPLWVASFIRSHVIALSAFAISFFSASVGKGASCSEPRLSETFFDVMDTKSVKERVKKAGGSVDRQKMRLRASTEPVRVATPT